MSFTIDDVRTHVLEQAHKNVSAVSGSVTYNSATRWIQRAIRHFQTHDFDCWKQEFILTLTAGTYIYPYTSAVWPTAALTRPLRLDGDSIRPYGARDPLIWVDSVQRMDEYLGGGQWKELGTTGTIDYVSERAQSIITGPAPDAAFIADSPTLRGYYFRGEDVSDTDANLAMYDDFFEPLTELSLVFGTQQVDDTEFRTLLQLWEDRHLTELRGYDHVRRADEPIQAPSWARYVDDAEDVF